MLCTWPSTAHEVFFTNWNQAKKHRHTYTLEILTCMQTENDGPQKKAYIYNSFKTCLFGVSTCILTFRGVSFSKYLQDIMILPRLKIQRPQAFPSLKETTTIGSCTFGHSHFLPFSGLAYPRDPPLFGRPVHWPWTFGKQLRPSLKGILYLDYGMWHWTVSPK